MSDIMLKRRRLKPALMACAAGVTLLASPALAQERRVDGEKILELLVAKGVISRGDADAIISQAEVVTPAPQSQAAIPPGGVAADGTQIVPYVPQMVRDQIVQQVRAELGTQAQSEGWSKPGETPEWTRRITLYGDVRLRGEARFYDKNNGDIFTNYGAINHGSPQNVNDLTPGWIPPAFVNTLEDRQRVRLRARLGVKARIDDWITADVRIATGADNSPISLNQTLGADGTGKYELWLDRASFRLTPMKDVNVDFGRFANPFWVSDLMFDNDMNFDGVAVSSRASIGKRFALFGAAGAFPVFNTDLNFGSRNAPEGKGGPYKSKDKYLLAAQAGFDFKPTDRINVRLGAGYFHYTGVEGEVSAPCYWYELTCSTDATRPAFQQFGNTMFPIRNIIPDPNDPVGSPKNQYFGLATGFRILNLRGAVDYKASDSFGVRFEGDFVKNLAWNRSKVAARAWNNLGPQISVPDPAKPGQTLLIDGPYDGGSIGWSSRVTVGSVLNLNWYGDWTAKPGDWNAYAGYRHLESDAVIDAFADSDMHIGGTNNKGWTVGGNYAFGKNTIFGVRWLSADQIADAPFSVDRIFVDLMTRF
ncbi:MAG: putative porin [Pseudomonadota bacterium]|uniref:putative porin n=1 Tax=Sphingomonas sp. ERG5 TaxID=1381597 RepID=UPI000AA6B166|nr:putative porin [Sphingomonas sp. ERG5]